MAKFPEGALDPNASDPPWTRLATIGEHLDAGEPVPPVLARWLSEAITQAADNPDTLIMALGLRNTKGRPSAWADPRSAEALERLWNLVHFDGILPEKAIEQVQKEFRTSDGDDRFSRPTLQRWLAAVRLAENEKWDQLEK
ncbi:MAG: hypothetical protein WCY92_13115 [Novosphingobium sp.]